MSFATRRVAVAVWVGILLTTLLFAGVTLGKPARTELRSPELAGLFLWVAGVVGCLGIVMSRVLPRRIGPRAETASRGATALARLLVAWAILEGAALFPLVAFLITGEALLFLVAAAVLAAHVSLFPTEGRWATLAAQPLPSRGGKGSLVP